MKRSAGALWDLVFYQLADQGTHGQTSVEIYQKFKFLKMMGYVYSIYPVYVEPRIMSFHQELREIWPIFMNFTCFFILNQFHSKKITFFIEIGYWSVYTFPCQIS